MPTPRPRVVILGAGFGGLACAETLTRARRRHHDHRSSELSLLSAAFVSGGDRRIIARRCRLADPPHSAPAGKRHRLHDGSDRHRRRRRRPSRHKAGPFPFDYLVIATGAMHSYFGHDSWADFAPGLKRIEDATRIRRSILSAFEQAELADDDEQRRKLLTFVIVGGGPTGVEMAGAIAEVARQTLKRDFRRIDPRTARIMLIEAGPRLLPAFSERHSATRTMLLPPWASSVLTSTVGDALRRARRRSPSTAASMPARWSGRPESWHHPPRDWLAADRRSRRPGHRPAGPFAAGTRQHFCHRRHRRGERRRWPPRPGLAAAAKQMGIYVGRLIVARLAGRTLPPFRYQKPRRVGDDRAARPPWSSSGPFSSRALSAGCSGAWCTSTFLIGLRNRFVVALTWLWGYITFQRGARLITEVPPPRPQV